jgi:uncharacterized membrane protein
MPWNRRVESPSMKERIISALCYPTGGIAGIIYIIISRSSYQSDFFRFHFLQSIVLVILSVLLGFATQALGVMLGPLVPMFSELLSKVIDPNTASQVMYVVVMLLGAIFKAFSLLSVYGLIWALLGKFAEIPFLSNVVRQQMR